MIKYSKQDAYKEVLKWLDEITIDDADGCGHPIVSFTSFDYKEQMLQSFKERFNIGDACDQQYLSDFIND